MLEQSLLRPRFIPRLKPRATGLLVLAQVRRNDFELLAWRRFRQFVRHRTVGQQGQRRGAVGCLELQH